MTGSIFLQFLISVLLSLLAENQSLPNIFLYLIIRKFSYWAECRVYICDQTDLKKKKREMTAYLYVNLREILFLIFWLIFILVLQNNSTLGTSLVIRCLGICLAVQGMRVQSLIREVRSYMPRGS